MTRITLSLGIPFTGFSPGKRSVQASHAMGSFIQPAWFRLFSVFVSRQKKLSKLPSREIAVRLRDNWLFPVGSKGQVVGVAKDFSEQDRKPSMLPKEAAESIPLPLARAGALLHLSSSPAHV